MKKKVYIVVQPVWSHHIPERLVGLNIEGSYVNRPKGKSGIVVELDLDIDDELFKPVRPVAAVKLERDPAAPAVTVTGRRVKSEAARAIT